MAPLPPTPKITEISCIGSDEFVPFVDGWSNVQCPAEATEAEYYVTLLIRGSNLSEEFIRNSDGGVRFEGAGGIGASLENIVDMGNGDYMLDYYATGPYSEGTKIQFVFAGVTSSMMPVYIAN